MKEFKGTNGEWQVVDDYDNYIPYSIDTPQIYIWNGDEQAHKAICDMGEIGDFDYAEELANARLLAASKDLLFAIRGLVNLIEKNPHMPTNGYLGKAKQAINKALNG